jgi:hypothetical protein
MGSITRKLKHNAERRCNEDHTSASKTEQWQGNAGERENPGHRGYI